MAMTETDEGTAPSVAEGRAGRVGWRRVILVILLVVTGLIFAEHKLGLHVSMWVLAGIAAAALLIFGLARYPHLQRHFHPFGLRERSKQRQRSSVTRTRRSSTGPKGRSGLPKLGLGGRSRSGRGSGSGKSGSKGRRGLKLPGSGKRSGSTGTGPKGKRPGGLLRKSGSGSRSRPGLGAKGRPGSRRGGSGGPKAGSGRRSGLLKRSGSKGRTSGASKRGSGGSRRHSPGFRRNRRVSGTGSKTRAGTQGKRKLTRPSTWRRHKPGQTPKRGGANTPQKLSRRQAWKARRAARRIAATGGGGTGTGPNGSTRNRSQFARLLRAVIPDSRRRRNRARWVAGPGGVTRQQRRRPMHPSTWRRPKTPAQQAAAIRKARRQQPGLARRGLQRAIGTPQQRHNRRAGGRARRATARAHRMRLARNPYTTRMQWWAPWRLWTRGPGARAQFYRWRVNRGHVAPRDRHGRKLPWGARIARRWAIFRGRHRGLGLGRRHPGFAQRPRQPIREAFARRQARLAARYSRWRRNRPAPRPLLGARHRIGATNTPGLQRFRRSWLGRRITHFDRVRQERWMSRRPAVSPVARPPARRKASSGGSRSGAGSRGGHVAEVGSAADRIGEMVQNWFDANDLDETLEQLHEIPRAIQDAFSHYAEQLRESTNLKESIPEAVAEAASEMAGIADKLKEAIDFGVQKS